MTVCSIQPHGVVPPSDDRNKAVSSVPNDPMLALVVDDSRMQRRLLSKALSKWGYEVLEAESGLEGLDMCKLRDFAIIVSDWMMPGMTGPEFCSAFRQMSQTSYSYFILLTSKGGEVDIAEGLNSGADDFLTKPVGLNELKARIKAGERIVQMQGELIEKNDQLNEAFEAIQTLYCGIERDLKEAKNLQQSLVPELDVCLPAGRLAMLLKPAGHIGGDLIGYFPACEDTIGVFSLDVSGHGVSSALMTARLAGYLSGLNPSQNIALKTNGENEYTARDPAETAMRLNEILLRELDTEHYFTLGLSIINLATGKMSTVQAGHPHPALVSKDGTTRYLGDGGLPIGLIAGAEYTSFEDTLQPGDRLILYSDGITECSNASDDLLDEEGFEKILSAKVDCDGPDLLSDLIVELAAFRGSHEFEDDISAIIFDYSGPA